MRRLDAIVRILMLVGFVNLSEATDTEPRARQLPVVEVPVGKQQIRGDLWRAFLDENLEADVAYWRQRAPLRTLDVLTAHNETLSDLFIPAVMQLVLIYDNKLYWPQRQDPSNDGEPTVWFSDYNVEFHRRLTAALEAGLRLPDVLFIYNTDDNAPRFNSPARNLGVPLLSIAKSVGLEGGDDLDILVPQFLQTQASMHEFPWHLKMDLAFFRGNRFCSLLLWKERYGYEDACARAYLAYLSYRDQQAGNSTALACGLVEQYEPRQGQNVSIPIQLPVLERVPFAAHARYKWLLHMEGITASYRLGQLFMVNSLVLKQRSHWIEFFYRSLRPWQHYVPFWNATGHDGSPLGMDDVYGTLDELRRLDREQPETVQGIIAEANSFAIQFLTPYARLMYLKAALTEYKALFPDMDTFLEEYVKELRAAGFNIPVQRRRARQQKA